MNNRCGDVMLDLEKEFEDICQELNFHHHNGEFKFEGHHEAIPVMRLAKIALAIKEMHFAAFDHEDDESFLKNDRTVGLKPSNLYLLALVIDAMNTDESSEISMILSGLAYRNYTLIDDYPETFYWASELMLRKHFVDLTSHSDGQKLVDGQADETFMTDFFEKTNMLLSVLDHVGKENLPLVQNRLIHLMCTSLYSFNLRICYNLPPAHVKKALEDSSQLTDFCHKMIIQTGENPPESMFRTFTICQDSIGELYQAAALYSSGSFVDKQDQVEALESPMFENKTLSNLIENSYNRFIQCSDIGHRIRAPGLLSMFELKLSNILALFPHVDHSEFLKLPHSDEHFSRALNNFQRLQDEHSEAICKNWIDAKSTSIETLRQYNKSGLDGYPLYFFYSKFVRL